MVASSPSLGAISFLKIYSLPRMVSWNTAFLLTAACTADSLGQFTVTSAVFHRMPSGKETQA